MLAANTTCKCAIAALVATGASAAAVSAATIKPIGSRTATGPFAVALITKDAASPKAMYYRARSTPAGEEIGIVKTMVCTRGSREKKKRYPVIKTTSGARVKVPVTLSNPKTCSLTVNAQLENRTGTKIKVTLYRR